MAIGALHMLFQYLVCGLSFTMYFVSCKGDPKDLNILFILFHYLSQYS